jgi:hypothetical protein
LNSCVQSLHCTQESSIEGKAFTPDSDSDSDLARSPPAPVSLDGTYDRGFRDFFEEDNTYSSIAIASGFTSNFLEAGVPNGRYIDMMLMSGVLGLRRILSVGWTEPGVCLVQAMDTIMCGKATAAPGLCNATMANMILLLYAEALVPLLPRRSARSKIWICPPGPNTFRREICMQHQATAPPSNPCQRQFQ